MNRASKREKAAEHNADYRRWRQLRLHEPTLPDDREQARRRRQIARGQLRPQNGLEYAW